MRESLNAPFATTLNLRASTVRHASERLPSKPASQLDRIAFAAKLCRQTQLARRLPFAPNDMRTHVGPAWSEWTDFRRETLDSGPNWRLSRCAARHGQREPRADRCCCMKVQSHTAAAKLAIEAVRGESGAPCSKDVGDERSDRIDGPQHVANPALREASRSCAHSASTRPAALAREGSPPSPARTSRTRRLLGLPASDITLRSSEPPEIHVNFAAKMSGTTPAVEGQGRAPLCPAEVDRFACD